MKASAASDFAPAEPHRGRAALKAAGSIITTGWPAPAMSPTISPSPRSIATGIEHLRASPSGPEPDQLPPQVTTRSRRVQTPDPLSFVKNRDRWGRRRLAAAGRAAPDDDQVGASKGDPLPFGQVAPAKDVLPVGVDGDLDRLGRVVNDEVKLNPTRRD